MSQWAFSQTECQTLKLDIIAALAAVEAKHGVKVSFPNRGTITHSGFEIKIALNKTDGDTGEDLGAKRDFDRQCGFFDLRPEDRDTEFTYSGRKLRLVSINSRAHRWPLNCEAVGGGRGCRLPSEAAAIIRAATDRAKGKAAA